MRDALLPLAADGQLYIDLPYAGALELADANEVRLTAADFERKLAAVRCHASQLSSLRRDWPDLLEPAGRSPASASAKWHSPRVPLGRPGPLMDVV